MEFHETDGPPASASAVASSVNMDKTEIAAEIRQFVMRESNIANAALLGDHVDLFRDGILDSLMVVSLVSFCEERFGCELSAQEFSEEDMRTIAALATLVAGKKA
jgi:acyl carrier protein